MYVFLTVSLVNFFHENLVNGYVLNFQTVIRFKTSENAMLSRVIKLSENAMLSRIIKLSIIIKKEVVVMILSNITWYSLIETCCLSDSGN